MKKSAIASLIGLVLTSPIIAAENIGLDDVVVTGSRFNENSSALNTNVKIITHEEIQNSPAINIPDLLRMQAGLNIATISGNQGIDASVDSRGFGDAAISNTLILLDGQRLNSVDSSSIQWASIPFEAIERIEIISGGGSVLYGDRATGGVINLITNKSGKSSASITASFGSYGYKSLDGFVSGGTDNLYFNTSVHSADGNGWRDNTGNNQWSISGRGGALFNAGNAFVDYSVYQVANGLPGSINSTAFQNDPRSARNPLDSQEKEGFRIRPGISIKLTDNVELATELSISNESQHFDYVSFPLASDRNLDTFSFTPRVKWAHGLGSLPSTSIIGFDYYHGTVDANYHNTIADQSAKQTSYAIYIQNNTAITSALDLNAGLRSQQMNQSANQLAFGDPANFGTAAISGNATNTKTVYDLGLTYHQTDWTAYAKLGSSFRFANTDELFGFDPISYQPIFSGNIIRPQTAINQEIGATFKQNGIDGKIAFYHTDVKNEIGYDSNLGINTNFDPTRHQGLETEIGWKLMADLTARLSYAYTDAKFTSGSYSGKALPSVPSNSAHAQILWDAHQYGKYVAQVNFVGQRYTSGDFTNSLNQLPSYTTYDLRANWDIKPVTISLTALNVTNKIYSPYAIFSTFKNDYYYYPADGRTVYLSVRYDFK